MIENSFDENKISHLKESEKEEEEEKNSNIIDHNENKNKNENEIQNLNIQKSYLNQSINNILNTNKDFIQPRLSLNTKFNNNNNEINPLTSPIIEEKNIDLTEYVLNQNEIDNEFQEEEIFPSRFIGNVMQISNVLFFSSYTYPYLEIQTEKKELRKYKNVNDYYSKKPMSIIKIKNIQNIEKLPRNKNKDYVIKITYYKNINVNKLSNEIILIHHSDSRDEWYENLHRILKSIKENNLPKIENNFVKIIDDQAGIVQCIKKNKKQINKISVKDFHFMSLLGSGGFSTVFKVRHKDTGKIYAMKVMNKNSIIKQKYLHYIMSEFDIMKEFTNFPFILNLHYCFQSPNYLFMVLDLCDGGDFTRVKKIENKKIFFAELILAFEYMHKKGIIYRDLKPENILLDSEGHIKVCDFNLAKKNVFGNTRAKSFCGSPLYLTPEMLKGKGVTLKADIYQIGLIIYELNTYLPAFMGDDLQTIYYHIRNNKINLNLPQIKTDQKLYDLLSKIFVIDEEKRLGIKEIKAHPYFQEIDWKKILYKKAGKIKIWNKKNNFVKLTEMEEYAKFKEEQDKLNNNNDYTYLDGKISVKEFYKDLKRSKKFIIREFFYDKDLDEKKIKFMESLSKTGKTWNNIKVNEEEEDNNNNNNIDNKNENEDDNEYKMVFTNQK